MPIICQSGKEASVFCSGEPRREASGGRSTRIKTVMMSSTTSQPTAIWPSPLSRIPRLSNPLRSTTVDAHERHMPKTMLCPHGQPQKWASTAPKQVASPIWSIAPGTAIFLTRMRSDIEKCRPTPNISSMTPISESSEAILTSPTNPGVAGEIIIPASK